MTKKLLCVMLCLIVVFVCVGCGGASDGVTEATLDPWLIRQSLEGAQRVSQAAGTPSVMMLSMQYAATVQATLDKLPVKAQIFTAREEAVRQFTQEMLTEALKAAGVPSEEIRINASEERMRAMALSILMSQPIQAALDQAAYGSTERPSLPLVSQGMVTMGQMTALFSYTRDTAARNKPRALTEPMAVYLEYDEQTAVIALFIPDGEFLIINDAIVPACEIMELAGVPAYVSLRAEYTVEQIRAMAP